jgi:hypothetical protein
LGNGCHGCDGGDPAWATRWLGEVGTYLLADYPYLSGASKVVGASCLSGGLTAVGFDVNIYGIAVATKIDATSRADFIKALHDQPLNVAFEVTASF